ncbi:MAG: metallophosphoesterase family protein [Kiritimatiellae bacterium]|nr:metallophosphoesterase family protein [Kiritimatiellia bacterium]
MSRTQYRQDEPLPLSEPIRRLCWITDSHLDFLEADEKMRFLQLIREQEADAVLLTGDISVAPDLDADLELLAESLDGPVLLVLGNHDYYGGNIAGVREKVSATVARLENLYWLPESGIVPLNNEVCVVGHGGWSDGGYGDFMNSHVDLSDFYKIGDFMGLSAADRLQKMQELADGAAAHFRTWVPHALERFARVIVATHVPPWPDVCVGPSGEGSDQDWLPHFCSRRIGEALLETMVDRNDHHMLVLCGHSHTHARVSITDNVTAWAGQAKCGKPQIQAILDIDQPFAKLT